MLLSCVSNEISAQNVCCAQSCVVTMGVTEFPRDEILTNPLNKQVCHMFPIVNKSPVLCSIPDLQTNTSVVIVVSFFILLLT